MFYTMVALNQKEHFLGFVDVDRCEVKEILKSGGLRTLEVVYTFKNLQKAKELFKMGNKIWVSGDINIEDCLYVVNTTVEEDIFKENSITVELEEVLVELNNAPLFFHTELTSDHFKTKTVNGQFVVKVDYNALNYWFGDYFNMGVVQDCLSDVASWINLTGSITRMSLLRKIEEETGNVFVTRYEKDNLDNTIHRYIDFLNPINSNKNWTLNIEYDFQNASSLSPIYDSNDHPTVPEKGWQVKRHIDNVPSESVTENDANWYQKGTEDPNWVWNEKDETVVDESVIRDYTPIIDLNPQNISIRITDGENVLNTEGERYVDEGDVPLEWNSEDIGFSSETAKAVISLVMKNKTVGLTVNGKSFPVTEHVGEIPKGYVDYDISTYESYTDYIEAVCPFVISQVLLPDDCFFEMYDSVAGKVLFRTCINRQIGHVHESILDLSFNIENIEVKVDESDTITAVSPIFEQNDSYTRAQLEQIMTWWKNRGITKGETIPMILEKIYVNARTQAEADASFGELTYDNFYWWPLNDQNQLDPENPDNNKFGFWRATAYWKAPFTKKAGQNYIALESTQDISYTEVIGRTDTRNEKGPLITPKMGTSTTTDEVDFQIYNQLALYLRNHMSPKVDITVDVASLEDGIYNGYKIHDKVYIKLPDYERLVVAKVTETTKVPNDPSKNSVKLSNYSINTIRTIQNETLINAENKSFEFPNTELLTVTLENRDYDSDDSSSLQYPSNKLVSFAVYKIENNTSIWTGETFTKTTNDAGEATIVMDYDPGYYEIKIQFGGDEEYMESSTVIKVNVGGKKEETIQTNEDGSTTKTTFYDKWGRSPDKKKIMTVGRISAPGDKGNYSQYWEGEFKNLCPYCHKATLYWGIFYAGNEYGNWGWFEPLKKRAPGSVEGHVFCANCDMDFSVQGNEHRTGSLQHFMTKTKEVKLSSKERAYLLKNGKMPYETSVTSQTSKNITNSTTRKVVGSVDPYVKKTALNVVGNKTGLEAAKAIASWMDKNIDYEGYGNFIYNAKSCLQRKRCNCCDGTRLYFELCDAAGCTEFFKMEYIHVYGHVYAKMTTKSTGSYVYVDNASSHSAWGYICVDYRNRSVLHKTVYPKLPF